MTKSGPSIEVSRRARRTRLRIVLGIGAILALAAAYGALRQTGQLDRLLDHGALQGWLTDLGPWGPILIIGSMALAIVLSPIPSAPIAMAAGAAYGHGWGTLYVAAGAEIGALVAFALARLLGQRALLTWLGQRPTATLLNRFMQSQNALTIAVFATRLLPFLSFDIISYAAGLTPLKTWRFACATLLGVIPASFLLAHFGDELASGDVQRVGLTVLALGTVTLLPFAWRALPPRFRRFGKRPSQS